MALKRLLLIRPGETEWNLQGRWQGWVASPLNEHGKLQVQRLATFIRHLGLAALYSSDHYRAVQTANILSDALGFEPIFDRRLRERNIGHWQGLTVPEIHGWYADEYEQLQTDPENFVIPFGESLAQVRQRSLDIFDEIMKKSETSDSDESVGIITHTTTIRVLVNSLIPDVSLASINFGNTSVTTLRHTIEGDGWELVATDDCSHLEGLESRHMPEVQGDDE
jgi:broad specificity phosphatase PhoE